VHINNKLWHCLYRAENAIKQFFERIGLATTTLYFATWSLFFKQDSYSFTSNQTIHQKCLQQGNLDSVVQDGGMDHKKQGELNGMEDEEENTCFLLIDDDDDDEMKRPPWPFPRKRLGREKKMEPKERGKKKELSKDEEPQCFAYEEYRDEFGRTLVRKRDYKSMGSKVEKEHLPFKFVYGLKDRPLWYERDYFKVYSPALIQILHEKLPDKIQLLGSEMIKIYVSDLFHKHDMLKRTMDLGEDLPSTKGDINKVKSYLKYMWQFVDASIQEIMGRYKAMKNEGCVSWDMLWAFFPPGTEVEYRCKTTGVRLCGKVLQSIKYMFHCNKPPQFVVSIGMWDYNCQSWQLHTIQREINTYVGGLGFTCLETHPLQFKSNPIEAERKFLENGAWFGKLAMKTRNRFMHYKGLMFICDNKEAVNGRVMIDLSSFAKMNPNYPMETATPSPEILRTNQVATINISTDDTRKYAPAIVYGFSFQSKKWGVFDICGFEEVVFNQLAYGALVMNQTKKDIIYGLVQKYERNQDEGQCENEKEEQIDPIVGKGSGCIFLCYGPPGTGKTFTAESISEKLKAPLWSLSVSELGTTPKKLEEKLVKVLDVAASWGAIVLLDEADIYMEKRTFVDLERNAMTGIFLRNLEYYRGVLFLTTNRVVAFDDAFCSRISMFLYYGKHSTSDRQIVWRNLLEPLKLQDLPDHLLEKFASYELNAREIRNVVQVARTLARRNGENLNGTYLTQSLVTLADSIEELKRVTGESNAHTCMMESR
jgi:hypothetical protein